MKPRQARTSARVTLILQEESRMEETDGELESKVYRRGLMIKREKANRRPTAGRKFAGFITGNAPQIEV